MKNGDRIVEMLSGMLIESKGTNKRLTILETEKKETNKQLASLENDMHIAGFLLKRRKSRLK